MNNLEKRAKELSARAGFLKVAPKKKYKSVSTFKYKSGVIPSAKPVLSPYRKSIIAVSPSKPEPKVIEVPKFYGKPGVQGPQGEKGESIIGPRGMPGTRGERGPSGLTPIKGQHYFTPKEIQDIQQEIISALRTEIQPHVETIIEKGVVPEVDAEFVKKIVQVMHTLPENDKLEVSKGIRNAQSFIFNKKSYKIEELMHGGGSSSSTSSTPLTPTGTVDGVNVTFGVVSQPTSVISDGITYFEGVGYSYAALVITLDVPPSQYIRYYS